jgi:hypothetical protein
VSEIIIAATNNLNLEVWGQGVGIPAARELRRVRYHNIKATHENTMFPHA